MKSPLHLFLAFGFWALSLSGPVAGGDKKDVVDPNVETLIGQLKGVDSIKAVMALADLGPKAASAAPHLVKLLEVKNEDLRLNAALAMSKIGAPAVSHLEEVLDHKDEDVRFYAVWSLGWIGAPAKSAAPQVVKLLADASDNVRRKAAFALGKISPEPEAAVRSLIGAFNDKSPEVRLAASEATAQFKEKAIPALTESLGSKDAQVVMQVLLALEGIGPEARKALPEVQTIFLIGDKVVAQVASNTLAKMGKEALEAFKEGLKSDRPEIRILAVNGLAKVGAPAAPDLVDTLSHPEVEIRRLASRHLANMRISDRMIVLGLAHSLQDKDRQVVLASLSGLQMLGAGGKEALPKLLALVEKADKEVLLNAFYALQNVRGEPKEVLPTLTRLMERKDLDRAALFHIFRILPGYGPDAVPLLLTHLKHADATVRLQAVIGLGNTTGDLSKWLPELEALMKDDSKEMRRSAAVALGRAGDKAVTPLREALKDPEPQVRWSAAQSFRVLGPAAKPALEDLTNAAIGDSHPTVRRNATLALGGLGAMAVEPLTKVLREAKDFQTQVAALQAFAAMTEKATPALDALIQALKSPQPVVRWNAANVLGMIGPEAKAAIPVLEMLTKDPHPTVRNNAVQALAKIRVTK